MQRLTDEQRQFAAEHVGLIWQFINRFQLGFGDPELQNDWYGIIAEAYLYAVMRYDSARNTFEKFAFCCMYKGFKRELTYKNAKKRQATIIPFSHSPNDALFIENISLALGETAEDIAVDRLACSDFITQASPFLTQKQRETFKILLAQEGDSVSAAACLGITPKTLYARILYARRRIKENAPPELQLQQGA